MLTKSFIEFLYEAAHIQRWNEHIRPMGFTELDKQAHKMMIVYVLARHEEDDHGAVKVPGCGSAAQAAVLQPAAPQRAPQDDVRSHGEEGERGGAHKLGPLHEREPAVERGAQAVPTEC